MAMFWPTQAPTNCLSHYSLICIWRTLRIITWIGCAPNSTDKTVILMTTEIAVGACGPHTLVTNVKKREPAHATGLTSSLFCVGMRKICSLVRLYRPQSCQLVICLVRLVCLFCTTTGNNSNNMLLHCDYLRPSQSGFQPSMVLQPSHAWLQTPG